MGSISIWHWVVVLGAIYFFFFDWRWVYDWYFIRRFVKRSNFQCRSVKIFKSRLAPAKAIVGRAKELGNHQLLWALNLDEHSAKAKTLIALELEERGLTAVEVANWLPEANTITSTSYAGMPDSVDAYRTLVSRRKALFRIFRGLAFPLIILLPVVVLQRFYERESADAPVEISILASIASIIFFVMFCLSIVASISGRRRSLRILLLRPFGDKGMTAALRRLVVNSLGPLAVTYTLSDRNYRPSIWLTVLERLADIARLALGALFKPSRRIARVRNERTFLNLARAVPRVIRPGYRAFLTGDQAFNIKATEGMWKLVVDMLIHSVDIIIMDVSRVGKGSAWEISQLRTRQFLSRCIFVVQAGYESDGLAMLREHISDLDAVQLLVYDPKGNLRTNSAAARFDNEISLAIDRRSKQHERSSM
ncbi:MAG TPA: hypothetical protein VN838_10935 [Bradyrhizobium sp.]|nr:hypothetical protein [Bradyrhizobium sp.]